MNGISTWQRLLASVTKPARRPLLVVSLPRSGSSWVGEVLGATADAMYLREPFTQTYFDEQGRSGLSFRRFETIPPSYESAAEAVIAGVPAFKAGIVRRPEQWRWSDRRRRRVVAKEVNPFALDWFLSRLQPDVVYLVRHPAAVALSFRRLGWSAALRDRLGTAAPPSTSELADLVRMQAEAWVANRDLVERRATLVSYEDLCADPVGGIRELAVAAGLEWSDEAEALASDLSEAEVEDTAPYGLRRPSAAMADAWRSEVLPDELQDMAAAWAEYDLDLYPATTW